jgi:hypothetical protein
VPLGRGSPCRLELRLQLRHAASAQRTAHVASSPARTAPAATATDVHVQPVIALIARTVRIAPTVRAALAAVPAAVRAPQVKMVHVLNHRSATSDLKVVTITGFLEDCTLNNPLIF